MKFTINREHLLKPLLQVAGVVERRQTLPVLSNILFCTEADELTLTGTDMEVQLVAKIKLPAPVDILETTIPAKKLVDICKSLPVDADIDFQFQEQKLQVRSGKSRFILSTLPASEFPNLDEYTGNLNFSINQLYLKQLIERTSFAMALQDVRFYLNGMLFEISHNKLRLVATDGHRLSLCDAEIHLSTEELQQLIVPRKAVLEISRLFSEQDEDVNITLSDNHIHLQSEGLSFTSKLIDGKFPDYQRVLPEEGDKHLFGEKDSFKHSFSRVAILSNEKYRGVRINIDNGSMLIAANNPEQEEAEEEIQVEYQGAPLEIGFNVNYLLDVFNVVPSSRVKIALSDSNSSALITDADDDTASYVVMPMRL